MKISLLLAMMMFSLTSFAAWNEVECEGKINGKTFRVEVEQAFPQGSFYKDANLFITHNGAEESHDFKVTTRSIHGMSRVEYMGAGLRLEVDFWPDQRPRWGWNYRGTLLSSALGNQYIQGLSCSFPNAF